MTCFVPDATHLRRKDLRDIALEVIGRIDSRGTTAVFLEPDGRVEMFHASGYPCRARCKQNPHSLVGIYNQRASAADIEADLAAMERLR